MSQLSPGSDYRAVRGPQDSAAADRAKIFRIDRTPYEVQTSSEVLPPYESGKGSVAAPKPNAEQAPMTVEPPTNMVVATVPITSVLRGGSLIVGASTLLAWVGTVLSGTVMIHPLLSIMLLVSSVAFYLMSRVDR